MSDNEEPETESVHVNIMQRDGVIDIDVNAVVPEGKGGQAAIAAANAAADVHKALRSPAAPASPYDARRIAGA